MSDSIDQVRRRTTDDRVAALLVATVLTIVWLIIFVWVSWLLPFVLLYTFYRLHLHYGTNEDLYHAARGMEARTK